jgi:hypothetical protein
MLEEETLLAGPSELEVFVAVPVINPEELA